VNEDDDGAAQVNSCTSSLGMKRRLSAIDMQRDALLGGVSGAFDYGETGKEHSGLHWARCSRPFSW